MIKNATFTSIWDGGYKVTTNCKVNMETREVFDTEVNNNIKGLNNLDYEYITIDGEEFNVINKNLNNVGVTDFWYNI